MKEEKDIDVKDIGELYEDLDAIHLKFEIRNVENGDYIMRSFYVNPENGSVQELLARYGISPRSVKRRNRISET